MLPAAGGRATAKDAREEGERERTEAEEEIGQDSSNTSERHHPEKSSFDILLGMLTIATMVDPRGSRAGKYRRPTSRRGFDTNKAGEGQQVVSTAATGSREVPVIPPMRVLVWW